MNNKVLMTQEGYNRLATELYELKNRRDRLVTQIEEVAQPDESGEDGLATQLKEELEVVNDKIDHIQEALEASQIISGDQTFDVVEVGSKVTLKLQGNSQKMFHIVSHLEANPLENKISDQSPLGQALLGKKIDDDIEVDAPVGKLTYKIVSIT